VIPTLPLGPRNRLAETILEALHDPAARSRLAALTSVEAARRWLPGDEARWAPGVADRARAAIAALADRPPLRCAGDLDAALAAAALLFDAGLYFEVHEVLEPHWAAAAGQAREALQGLIQVAVGWQHLANGNVAGARALLAEGGARLHGARLGGLDVDGFARAAVAAAARLATAGAPAAPPFPRA
jgi:predicted metal-dependent hydrolase